MLRKNIIIVLIIFLFSCKKQEAIVPSYIYIPEFLVSIQDGQGTNKHNITDAWIFINGQKKGTYELPAHFPVLMEGKCKIEILPGIKLNGIAATRAIYPFLQKFEIDTTLIPDSTIKIIPETRYKTDLKFEIIEDFENIGFTFEHTSRSKAKIEKLFTENEAIEGYYGEVTLNKLNNIFEIKSFEKIKLYSEKYNFVEIHCKNTISFVIGLFANEGNYSTQNPILVVTPSKTWKKIYVNLTPTVSRLRNANDFNLFIAAELPDTIAEGKIFLDNIKLIH